MVRLCHEDDLGKLKNLTTQFAIAGNKNKILEIIDTI
jgi:hypothetical protein